MFSAVARTSRGAFADRPTRRSCISPRRGDRKHGKRSPQAHFKNNLIVQPRRRAISGPHQSRRCARAPNCLTLHSLIRISTAANRQRPPRVTRRGTLRNGKRTPAHSRKSSAVTSPRARRGPGTRITAAYAVSGATRRVAGCASGREDTVAVR
ncbi:hypothetical protein EVAR_6572_1 [Eumeta japonica]|uniref:Uncharacterized protein n=1 Tax=Eumeta variegata TaxID=151549 RepID=A0A4C1SQX3_EUMVA|nr:hypothetical protein EVAR_6572_1 [Eumeta japonica]